MIESAQARRRSGSQDEEEHQKYSEIYIRRPVQKDLDPRFVPTICLEFYPEIEPSRQTAIF